MNDFDIIIQEFFVELGFAATYIKKTQGDYNPATGEASETTVEIPVKAIQLDLPLTRNGASTISGTAIQDGDKQVFVQPPQKTEEYALPIIIDVASDKINLNGVLWNIVTFKEINPTGLNQILIELYVRR